MRITAGPGDVGALAQRARARLGRVRGAAEGVPARVLIGITGAPGAGKSTLAGHLATALDRAGVSCVVVGMDGFHLAQTELDRLGRAERKGAPDTFDAHGYLALLRRLRTERDHTVYAPQYMRGAVEQPIGSAVPVDPAVQVVLTEGNYLLLDSPPWAQVPGALDEVWFLRADDSARRERLLARHLDGGKSRDQALAFTDGSDAANARLVADTAPRADVIIDWLEAPADK